LLAFGREVEQRGGDEVGSFEDFEVALGRVVALGAVDDGLGRFVPSDFLVRVGKAGSMTGPELAELNEVGGRAAAEAAGEASRALLERSEADNGESTVRRATGRNRDGSTFRIRRKSGIRAVDALVKSVTLPPMPEAVPPREVIAEEFAGAWNGELADRISRLTA
jgi:hypothetical protein